MDALTTLMNHHLVRPFRRTRMKLQLLAGSDAGYALRTAVTTLLLAITDRRENLLNELRLTELL